MSRLSIPRRHDGGGVPRPRLGAASTANVVAATHVIGSICRVSTWVLEPLLPLLTCCFLVLFGATVAAAMRSESSNNPLLGRGNQRHPLDENGSLVNFTTPRRLLHEVKPPLTAATAANAAAAAAAAADSSVVSAEEGAGASQTSSICTVLTNEAAERLCADLADGQLPSFSVPKAARRLRHCDVFDFRHLLVYADSLVPSSEEHNCSLMLLTDRERDGVRINKSRCSACLSALIAADDQVAGMAQLFTNLLAKYQCYILRDDASVVRHSSETSSSYSLLSTSSSSISSSSSSSSSALTRRRNATGEVAMTPQTDAGASNCKACKVAYNGWLCTKNFTVYPFSTVSDMPLTQRFQAQPACTNWCAAVETNCPYFTPGEDQENGGEPVFLCDEAHYHHSSHYRVPSDPCEQDSRRHSCCFTRQDTDCRPLNKTCPSLRNVCFEFATSVVSAAPNSTINTSTSSSPVPQSSHLQQQQYLAQSQNATLDTNNATSPASGSAPRTISCAPLLLLTAFLLSCRRELT